ncbi:hypothetical protein POV27_11665 [Aureisphaera galaxeae]|uniref:hypothetical protein n=1 Tax=Aureisphaera galaxeae TaxID=1538023 RepID=UPI0023507530|nr:hypothetical protein [Aureisphaera galaxeae]MDC8004710.1 hypothetical protein [Aureisphaera galaxeae]
MEKRPTILSDKYEALIKNEGNVPAWIDTDTPEVPAIFKHFEYPVSAWPVVIDRKTAASFREISAKLPQYLAQIPALYFDDSVKDMADFYFNGNETVTEFALMCHKKRVEVSCRLDVVLTSEGLKVLEANIGSGIGGWQICSFLPILRKLHPKIAELESGHEIVFRNTQYKYLEFLIDKIRQYVDDVRQEVNIYISIDDEEKTSNAYMIAFLDELMKEVLEKKGLTGGVYSGDLSSLQLIGSELFIDGKRIHGFLKMDEKELPPEVFRAFILDKVYWPDHLGELLNKDKRNLALLRELAEKRMFSTADNQIILNSIPWTAIMEDKKVMFREQEYDLVELLRSKQNQFVIKVANGFQGINVHVGKFLSAEAWENAIQESLGNTSYIAQEFSDSIDFWAPNSDNEWAPHKLIWGTFGFGNTYGGAFVRMSAVKTDVGVINAAAGAVEALVYESIS